MSELKAAAPDPTEIANRYLVERKLGAGAFGTVYKAKDKILGRMVAIKTIRLEGLAASGAGLDELLTRFMREAQVSAQLKHPNIVTIYDIGELHGLSYLAMEFIDGVGLEKLIKETGPMPVERAASIAAQMADALDYAHRQSVVHRDIKPANVMLEAGDRVKVADFGIARVTNSAEHLTATGSLLGTPSYMSPEQARGQELDGRSDLFSVGCVLYEMLAGQRAFRGDSITGLIFKVITEEPQPLKELRPDAPDEIVRVVERAMSKSPQARFQSGRELFDALRPLIPTGATPTVRQRETATAASALEDLVTARSEPTALGTPTQALAKEPGRPLSPPPPPIAPPAVLPPVPAMPAPAQGRPSTEAPHGRAGISGLVVGLAGAAIVVLGIAALAGWFFFVKPRGATMTVAEQQVAPPTTAPPATAPPAVQEEAPPTSAAEPPATAPAPARPEAPAHGAVPPREARLPPPARATPPPIGEPQREPPAVQAPPAAARPAEPAGQPPGEDFSHLDDDEAIAGGGEGVRSLPPQYRGSGSSQYRVRSKVPAMVAPFERPAVATILYLIGAEEAYNNQHGRYASLQELTQSRSVRLDVPVKGNGFSRRSYRFHLEVEDDGFKVVASPAANGRPFVGDDTGFVRVGLQ